MCGRYFVDDEMWREIKKICKQIDDSKLKVTRGDVRPTDMAVVLMGMKEVRTEQMQWGFTQQYQEGLLINARAETVLSKPSFRDSMRHCRCVIPAAGFYEWNKAKSRSLLECPSQKFSTWPGSGSQLRKKKQFTILTTSPNDSVSPVHDRMPLVLTSEEIIPWIQSFDAAEKLLTKTPPIFWSTSRSTSSCHFLSYSVI